MLIDSGQHIGYSQGPARPDTPPAAVQCLDVERSVSMYVLVFLHSWALKDPILLIFVRGPPQAPTTQNEKPTAVLS